MVTIVRRAGLVANLGTLPRRLVSFSFSFCAMPPVVGIVGSGVAVGGGARIGAGLGRLAASGSVSVSTGEVPFRGARVASLGSASADGFGRATGVGFGVTGAATIGTTGGGHVRASAAKPGTTRGVGFDAASGSELILAIAVFATTCSVWFSAATSGGPGWASVAEPGTTRGIGFGGAGRFGCDWARARCGWVRLRWARSGGTGQSDADVRDTSGRPLIDHPTGAVGAGQPVRAGDQGEMLSRQLRHPDQGIRTTLSQRPQLHPSAITGAAVARLSRNFGSGIGRGIGVGGDIWVRVRIGAAGLRTVLIALDQFVAAVVAGGCLARARIAVVGVTAVGVAGVGEGVVEGQQMIQHSCEDGRVGRIQLPAQQRDPGTVLDHTQRATFTRLPVQPVSPVRIQHIHQMRGQLRALTCRPGPRMLGQQRVHLVTVLRQHSCREFGHSSTSDLHMSGTDLAGRQRRTKLPQHPVHRVQQRSSPQISTRPT